MSEVGGGVAVAAYMPAVTNAVKACGTIVRVEPQDFLKIVGKQEQPLIVRTSPGVFYNSVKYLISYKGLAFHFKSKIELSLPRNAELNATFSPRFEHGGVDLF